MSKTISLFDALLADAAEHGHARGDTRSVEEICSEVDAAEALEMIGGDETRE